MDNFNYMPKLSEDDFDLFATLTNAVQEGKIALIMCVNKKDGTSYPVIASYEKAECNGEEGIKFGLIAKFITDSEAENLEVPNQNTIPFDNKYVV